MKFKRLNHAVRLTKSAHEMFPGEPCGTLLYVSADGRWAVRRDGSRRTQLWARGYWTKRDLGFTKREARRMAEVEGKGRENNDKSRP